MKSVMPVTAIIALLGSSTALAANLNIPMAFEYLAVDGTEVGSSLFNHKADIELDNGVHKIAIRYHDMVQDDFSDGESFIKSSPFIVTLTVDGDHEYSLKAADGVIRNPKSFAKSPKVVITRHDSGVVDYSVKQTDFTEDSFVKSIFGGGSGQDVASLSSTATGAGLAVTTTTTAAASITAPISKPAPIDSMTGKQDAGHAEQMLQYWWLHADHKTRKEFMSWAIQQL
ncbi:DUF2057 domain-containing protein [Shewanella sp. D64]|uniref:DUF2057 domain-containing protein n=1 Tax=unclassified Shewanella TaxID=196818 RepID=UPI0022BA2E74|nr:MULTISPECIES: DUF2057 domain-containing protein [unclassified Shewanella]MEC4726036.1 DUF2057 domain-containing protein [Shewanella sp. D64]MEC4737291.1 DUF2057 domain-containing protein [Shewanella sp. E94]WBJ93668.1 DUF2057 domain-containing protein [Shewanella sp. MTB7]